MGLTVSKVLLLQGYTKLPTNTFKCWMLGSWGVASCITMIIDELCYDISMI